MSREQRVFCVVWPLFSGVGSQSGNAAGAERGPATGAISHGGQELTEPLLSCPVPETPGRMPWRPPGYIKIPRGG